MCIGILLLLLNKENFLLLVATHCALLILKWSKMGIKWQLSTPYGSCITRTEQHSPQF